MHLDELDFQAKTALNAFERAWTGALKPTADEDTVWADLQATLFAAIIVERLIRPTESVPKDAAGRYTRAEAKAQALHRAGALRDLLGIPDDLDEGDPTVLYVSPVRDPMEHIDERFDRLVLTNAVSVSDRYISLDGQCLASSDGNGMSGASLRVFIPAAGYLIFDGTTYNMFKLDADLLTVRANMADARSDLDERLRIAREASEGPNRYAFVGSRLVNWLGPDYRQRVEAFMAKPGSTGEYGGVGVA